MHPDRFLTSWALLAHLAYAVSLVPNTFPLALFVLVGSEYVRHFVTLEPAPMAIHLTTHYLPVALFVYFKRVEWDLRVFVSMSLLYLAYHGFGIKKLTRYYRYQMTFFFRRDPFGCP